MGNSRGWDGVVVKPVNVRVPGAKTLPAAFTRARYDAFPTIELTVGTSAVLGLPDDLQGSGGAPGGRVIGPSDVVFATGGEGSAGGAGLCIICRGMSIGGSGNITLDGADAAPTSSVDVDPYVVYPGCGGAGGPGAFLLLLDGDTISVPEITLANFSAKTGSITQLGNPLAGPDGGIALHELTICGYEDPALLSALHLSADVKRRRFWPV